ACDLSGSSTYGPHRRPPVTTEVVRATRSIRVCRGEPQLQPSSSQPPSPSSPQPPPPPPSPSPPQQQPGRDCHTFQAGAAIAAISINTRGDHAAIVTGAAPAQSIETWDLTTGTRIARFAAGTTAKKPCAHVAMLDDTVLLSTGVCLGAR